ncbi:putative pentatricopeptide [Medicago truncatula]|uniref:Putative pentatricopeptide n=1 Tax=Medicago truncatula TaxID=3880 RepID=A0A396HW55_MEDTR|nr:putative pentatricopeptide [Medicago truncatula]
MPKLPSPPSQLIQTIASTSPNPSIIATLIHFLVQSKKLPEAQSLLLRIIRKSGVSRAKVIDSLISSSSSNLNSNQNVVVFDLLIRTYVQARKLREGFEAFQLLRKRGFCVSINACNALLGSIVKVRVYLSEMEAKGFYADLVTYNTVINAYFGKG